MSKTATVVLALLILSIFPAVSKAQIIQSGNVYAGVAYAESDDVIPPRLAMRGFVGSVEVKPFIRFPHLGFVLDGAGVFTSGVQQYNLVLGPRLSKNYGKWRIFAHATAGYQQATTGGETFHPLIEDGGAGIDRRLPFKRFAWRVQGDYIHSHMLDASQNDFRLSTGLVWRF